MANFRRISGNRRYKKMFVIVAEGTVTEQEYFSMFDQESVVRVNCLTNYRNLPPQDALKKVLKYLSKEHLRSKDEIWVVVDRDSWDEKSLNDLHKWSSSGKNYGFALSNPRFECWLLLHFEDAKGRSLSLECDTQLKKHIPGYSKHINTRLFTSERISAAIARAKKHDSPPCTDWPRKAGSTVYKLVEKLIASRA